MRIERVSPGLETAIRALLLEAFPSPAEADLVDRLRHDGDIAIARVAVDENAVLGCVVLSPMAAAPMKALGLGPVAVASIRRRQGICGRLIRDSLEQARDEGWEAVFVLGEPAYYARFGFDAVTARGFTSPYAGPCFMALALQAAELPIRFGRVEYAPAFRGLK